MFIKILLSAFLLGLNCYVFIYFYMSLKFKLLPILFLLLLTIAIWVVNYEYGIFDFFISKQDLLLLIIFSYVQFPAWYFYKFIFGKAFRIKYDNEDGASANSRSLTFNNVKKFIFSVIIPVVISINQLSAIWGLNW